MSVYPMISNRDPEIAQAMEHELLRQQQHLELIASENFVSGAVLEACGSHLTNKYAEGYPGKRYYGGCENVDVIETLAIERAKELFHAEHANVQPHSGSQANAAVYFALLQPNDVVLGMRLDQGGHLTHGSGVNFSGKLYQFVSYGVDPETGYVDYDNVRALALEHHPKLIVAGYSAYPRQLDFAKFRAIADEVGAYFMVDMAHFAGLVAAGDHPSPVPYADVVTSTTHKTLRGPRGGLILCKAELAKKIDKAVFPGMQGGPLEHIIAAKAICFKEALTEEYREYIHQVVRNSKALANGLLQRGITLVSGGTDNHLILLDLRSINRKGNEMETLLHSANITTNKNAIPMDPEKPTVTSGIRIGTAAVTTRGMKEAEMDLIAEFISTIAHEGESTVDTIKSRVLDLCSKFPIYE